MVSPTKHSCPLCPTTRAIENAQAHLELVQADKEQRSSSAGPLPPGSTALPKSRASRPVLATGVCCSPTPQGSPSKCSPWGALPTAAAAVGTEQSQHPLETGVFWWWSPGASGLNQAFPEQDTPNPDTHTTCVDIRDGTVWGGACLDWSAHYSVGHSVPAHSTLSWGHGRPAGSIPLCPVLPLRALTLSRSHSPLLLVSEQPCLPFD